MGLITWGLWEPTICDIHYMCQCCPYRVKLSRAARSWLSDGSQQGMGSYFQVKAFPTKFVFVSTDPESIFGARRTWGFWEKFRKMHIPPPPNF
jgi:hypothetical protein